MVSKGARNLVLLSRSGAVSNAACGLVSELKSMGVYVDTPCCDASLYKDLNDVLQYCTCVLPPIKGCINAAMALQVQAPVVKG